MYYYGYPDECGYRDVQTAAKISFSKKDCPITRFFPWLLVISVTVAKGFEESKVRLTWNK